MFENTFDSITRRLYNFSWSVRYVHRWFQWAGLDVLTLLTLAVVTIASPAAAQGLKQPNGLTWGELSVLPVYCKDAAGIVYGDRYFNRSPNAGRWEAAMGLDFWHIHHYCYALAALRRAPFTLDPQKRRFLLGKVLADLMYVVKNSQPTMVLMPEIWTRIGDVQGMLGDVGAALEAYETAMVRKPDYWPAYLNAAELFLKAGVKPRGIEILLRGIDANPGSTQLRDRYKAAGGNPARLPPLPSVAALASAPEASASAPDAAASSTSSP